MTNFSVHTIETTNPNPIRHTPYAIRHSIMSFRETTGVPQATPRANVEPK
ncbi:hypothetical protein [Aureliella helgolandensis]|nr:hypothetical protein [Aureliella helgolandensis]